VQGWRDYLFPEVDDAPQKLQPFLYHNFGALYGTSNDHRPVCSLFVYARPKLENPLIGINP
jgi:hypothetical protein